MQVAEASKSARQYGIPVPPSLEGGTYLMAPARARDRSTWRGFRQDDPGTSSSLRIEKCSSEGDRSGG
jgi:hypothetical protein